MERELAEALRALVSAIERVASYVDWQIAESGGVGVTARYSHELLARYDRDGGWLGFLFGWLWKGRDR